MDAGSRATAARSDTPTITAVAIAASEPIRLDGELNEAVWLKAGAVTGFVQREPSDGSPASHDTEVRVAFDTAAVYVAVRAHEPESERLVGMLTRRDESSPSDWIRVAIDSFRDRRTAYEFGVNAAGVKIDRYWHSDTAHDPGWDAVWDVAVRRSADHWSAEFRIPFSQLRFNPASDGTFGFAVLRTVAHENETSSWPHLPRSASGFVSSFGDLTGLQFPASQKRLELLPYALGQMRTAPVAAGNPLASSPSGTSVFGLDARYRLAGGLTLVAAVNPDFGQVEADPAVVNLGAFETFFAERRPFFVEGSGNFSFDIDCNDGQCTGLFYSRRIGRSPQRLAAAPPGGFASQPANTTIAGAAKLTGRVGAFSLGVLQAVTTSEDARLASGPGQPSTLTPVEPASSFTVARLGREFSNRSRIGFAFTNTGRALANELRFLPGRATTGGIDGEWRLGDGSYSLRGFWAASQVTGDAGAIDRLQRSNVHSFQRPDARSLVYDPTRTSLAGHAASVNVGKIAGRHVRFNAYAGMKSPGFDVNDLGFMQRADEITQSNWLQIRSDRPGRFFRTVNVNVNQWAGWNFDGDLRYRGGNVNAHWVTLASWSFGAGVTYNGQGLQDRLTRGGPSGYSNPTYSLWSYVNSDSRRPLVANVSVSGFADRFDSQGWNVSPSVTWRPSRALSATTGFGVSRNLNQAQWVANVVADGRTRYVFGRLHHTTVSMTARVNYTLTPTLSLQMYAQPFVSAGDYSNFRELADGRSRDYHARYAPFAFGGQPDFSIRSFRTTNVLRWEYRPGSVLFVVWQQGRDGFAPSGDFEFGRDFGRVFESPATNLFLVKVSRWLNW